MGDKMPALFIGHGNPMNTLEQNGFTDAWQTLGRDDFNELLRRRRR